MLKPAIEASEHLTLKAIFSRTLNSAQSLAESASTPQELYAEDGQKGFNQLLERSDITAFVVSLVDLLTMTRSSAWKFY